MTNVVLAKVGGLLKSFSEKIGNEDGERWLAEFEKFLLKDPTWNATRQWSTWGIFQVGGQTKDQLVSGIQQSGMEIGNWALDTMKQKSFKTSSKAQEVAFVRMTPSDLGFTGMPTTDELYARAEERRLDLCLADDAPAIRQQYKNQPDGEVIWFAMKQIADSDGDPRVFGLSRDGGRLWLHSPRARPGNHWLLGGVVVFRLSKSSS